MTDAEKIAELRHALERVRNMCDAPHWTNDRRWRIRDIADSAIKRTEDQ